MKVNPSVLVAIVGVVPLIIATVAMWTWLTIPPAPDPDTLPSQVLEPPSAAFGDAVEEGRAIARELLAEEKLPGLSLAVAVNGEMVWAEGFRWANMETQTPVTPETLFRTGGISQSLTATAVGLLIDRGQLDLDAPLRRYLHGFPDNEWPFTTRQVMSHTSGLRPHRAEGGLFPGPRCMDDSERLAIFAEDPLRFPPGTDYGYSTFGWMLTGALVASVAQEPYLDFMQREIFAPLRMESTVPDVAETMEPNAAFFYYPRLMLNPRHGLHDAPAVDLSCYLAAVGFLSTPSDLVRFGSAMMGGGLLDDETVEDLQTPLMSVAPGEFNRTALGWTVGIVPMGSGQIPTRVVGQGLGEVVRRMTLGVETVGGQVAGSTTSLLLVPEHRIAIAVATNVSGAENVPSIATRIADVFVRHTESPGGHDEVGTESTAGPAWAWAKSVTTTGTVTPMAYAETVTDGDGNSYITNYAFSADGQSKSDVYLVKHDALGNKIWEVLHGGPGRDAGQDVALDQQGNVWVVGFFQNEATFGRFNLTGDSEYNLFLAQYDVEGTCLAAYKPATNNDGFNYALQPIGSGQLGAITMSISDQNEIYISSLFERRLSFGQIELNARRGAHLMSSVFIAKFNSHAECLWAITSESDAECYHSAQHYAPDGSSFLSTNCTRSFRVGDKSFQGEGPAILMAKVDAHGECQWIRAVAERSEAPVTGGARSPGKASGYSFLASGFVEGDWSFGGIGIESLESKSYLAEYDEEGQCRRVMLLSEEGLPGGQWIWAHTTDDEGNRIVAGQCSGSTYFGDRLIEIPGGSAGYVAQYSSQGEFQWIELIPSTEAVLWPRAVNVIDDAIYLTGSFLRDATFGDTVLRSDALHDAHEIFLARLDRPSVN